MLVRIAPLFALILGVATAETATRATPIQSAPNEQSAVLSLIKGGEPLPEINPAANAPFGWTAVSLPGPHDVFVENRFIGKDLDVKPGSPLHTAPKSDSPILTEFNAGDEMEITGLRGRWTQLRISKSITGYIQQPDAAAPLRTAPVVRSIELRDSPNAGSTTTTTPSQTQPRMGQAVSRTTEERGSLAALPRLFEGRLKSTRVPLRPRRPYDYALETEEGVRFAYVDLSKLLLTEQIENYLHHSVVVYGVARPVPDTKDIVIEVESFQLR